MCELHFVPEDIERETSYFNERTGTNLTINLKIPRLRKGAVPSQLPNCPSYLSRTPLLRESPEERKCRKEQDAIKTAIAESVEGEVQHKKKINFETLSELSEKLGFLDKYWKVIKLDNSLLICNIICRPSPKIKVSLIIDDCLAVNTFVDDVEMHRLGNYKTPSHVKDIDSLEELLDNLKKCDTDDRVSTPGRVLFLMQHVLSLLTILREESSKYKNVLRGMCEQVHLMTLKRMEYSSEFLVFSSLLYSCSPQGYRLLRTMGYMILPCYSTVRRLTLSQNLSPGPEQHNSNFLSYIKNKFKFLSASDLTVTLMIDEIHIKPYFDYKGGSVVGSAFDTSEAAKSAFVFMVSSLCSKFKDVVHILPTRIMKAETLFTFIKKVIIGLEEIGFKVICVVTDNNSINRKAMSYFAEPPTLSIVYPHPSLQSTSAESRPLFFMFDAVHLLKCVRNNWLGQKDIDKTMKYPQFCFDDSSFITTKICSAPFVTLRKLHSLEAESLLTHAYKLTLKSLCPSNLEKQSVNLVHRIFNEYVIQALLTLGEKHCLPFYREVADYVRIIYVWWTVMNVNSPYKGARLKQNYAKPLTDDTDNEGYMFLHKFCDWLDAWNITDVVSGKLSKETFTALRHTTLAMIQVTSYCLNELKMSYVLTSKFQTDQLEARFSQYRQLAGSNYNVSMRQVFECEKKLRLMSVLKIPLRNQNVDLSDLKETKWEKMYNDDLSNYNNFTVEITENDIEKTMEYLPVLTYLAGYCCYVVTKKNKCNSCRDLVTYNENVEDLPDRNSYIKGITRGSLLYPDERVVNIVMYNYIAVNKLTENPDFTHSLNQRNVATEITMKILAYNDVFLSMNSCSNEHSIDKVQKMIVWASTNALLNNFCRKENDLLHQSKKSGKKRKLQTLTG